MSLHAAMHGVLLATRGHGLGGALRAWVVALAAVSAVQCAARAAVAQLSRRSASRAFLCWRDRLGVTRVRLRVAARYIGRRLCRGFTAWSAMLDARQQLRRTVRGAAKRLRSHGIQRLDTDALREGRAADHLHLLSSLRAIFKRVHAAGWGHDPRQALVVRPASPAAAVPVRRASVRFPPPPERRASVRSSYARRASVQGVV